MPYQHCGLDIRNMSPIPSQLLSVPAYQHVQFFYTSSTTDHENQTPFFFYCPGGLMEICVQGLVNNVNSALHWDMRIDGDVFNDTKPILTNLDSSGTGSAALSGTVHRILPPGMHWALLTPVTMINDNDLSLIRWSAKFIPNGHPNHLSNRGILPASNSLGVKTEKSY
jgi:hypothetical protein